MKRIEVCFIAPRSLGANDYNHLMNVIAPLEVLPDFFFSSFLSLFFLPSSPLSENKLETSSQGSINRFMLFEIAIYWVFFKLFLELNCL